MISFKGFLLRFFHSICDEYLHKTLVFVGKLELNWHSFKVKLGFKMLAFHVFAFFHYVGRDTILRPYVKTKTKSPRNMTFHACDLKTTSIAHECWT